MLLNVNQMEIVGSTTKMNVVVEMGRMNGQKEGDDNSDGNWTGVRRYYISRDYLPAANSTPEQQRQQYRQSMSALHSKAVWSAKNLDMGDYRTVVDFARWAKGRYPAKKYMLILWDHGSGWMDPKKEAGTEVITSAISKDEQTGHFISTKEIGQLVRAIGGVDVLGFDACLMQMAEVAFEVKGGAKYILGSEEEIPNTGIDYKGFLSRLAANTDASPGDAPGFAVTAVNAFYTQQNRETVTMSVINAQALQGFAERLNRWSDAALKSKDAAALAYARDGVLRFNEFDSKIDPHRHISTYGDIYNFVGLAGTKNAALKKAGEGLLGYISQTLVTRNTVVAPYAALNYKNAHGFAVDIPRVDSNISDATIDAKYLSNKRSDLAFSKAAPRWEALRQWMESSSAPPNTLGDNKIFQTHTPDPVLNNMLNPIPVGHNAAANLEP